MEFRKTRERRLEEREKRKKLWKAKLQVKKAATERRRRKKSGVES